MTTPHRTLLPGFCASTVGRDASLCLKLLLIYLSNSKKKKEKLVCYNRGGEMMETFEKSLEHDTCGYGRFDTAREMACLYIKKVELSNFENFSFHAHDVMIAL